jgi:hypothetical protein
MCGNCMSIRCTTTASATTTTTSATTTTTTTTSATTTTASATTTFCVACLRLPKLVCFSFSHLQIDHDDLITRPYRTKIA